MKELYFVNPYRSEGALLAFKSLLPDDYSPAAFPLSFIGACDEEGYALGLLGFDDLGEQIDIVWLYVSPHARRKGVAEALIKELLDFYTKTGDLKPIIARFEKNTSDDSLYNYFTSSEFFDVTGGYTNYKVSMKNIVKPDWGQAKENCNILVNEFFDLSEDNQKTFIDKMQTLGHYDVVNFEKWEKISAKQLCLYTTRHYEINSAIFITQPEDNHYEVSFLYSEKPQDFVPVLNVAIDRLKSIDSGAELSVSIMNEASEKLMKKLFTDYTPNYSMMVAEWNYNLGNLE